MLPTIAALFGAFCDGSSACSEKILTSVLALGLVVLLGALLASRFVRVNLQRRRAGQAPLSWRAIADARTDRKTMIHGEAAGLEAQAKELKRQTEWERRVAAMEMARYGRSRTRAYCSTHNRHCKNPIEQPHPPGGIDNERAPADWEG